ncbi:MAG: hypothetical protein K8T20_09470 [Planctomycetes bacterium]|nr:hypothetical protein [Planctomycetota bacterium]
MLKDLPGGAERWTFEFERKEEEDGIDSHQWISSRFLTEKGVLAGIGLLSPRTNPDQLDGVLRARFQFIERARKFKLGRRPGDDGAHPQAGFGFRVQEGVEAWGAGLEDLDGDQVKAIIGHVTQFKPKVEIDAVKSLEVALPGDEMFDLWVSFHGNHLVLGIGDKEVLAVDDGRLTKPGNLFFFSLGAGVKLDRVVFERSK